jgi:hypothetical protein
MRTDCIDDRLSPASFIALITLINEGESYRFTGQISALAGSGWQISSVETEHSLFADDIAVTEF